MVDFVIASHVVTEMYLINMSYDVLSEKHHRRFCEEDWDWSVSGAVKDKENEPNTLHIFCSALGRKAECYFISSL